uniref:Uncharacterized protein n=1 Tax=Leersia perrieri TaxID=77586 RepID=A0A0D9VCG8_9ORYZ
MASPLHHLGSNKRASARCVEFVSKRLSIGMKAPSLVVAASMGAVEALKDQAGLCRWGYALRAAAASAPTLSKPKPNPASSPAAKEADLRRLRKAHHLICWGPN